MDDGGLRKFILRPTTDLLLLLLLLIPKLWATMAEVYSVGDSLGWDLNVNYTQWASKHTFALGDSLVFSFGASHSVLMVEETDYVLCNIRNPMAVIQNGRPVTLSTRKNFFICGVPGHCITGMKVAVYVTEARTNSPSSMEIADQSAIAARYDLQPSAFLILFLVLFLNRL